MCGFQGLLLHLVFWLHFNGQSTIIIGGASDRDPPIMVTNSLGKLSVGKELDSRLWPIVYHPIYTIKFFLLEKSNAMYTRKWAHIMHYLEGTGIAVETVHQPREITERELMIVHTEKYLKSLKKSLTVANISDLCYMALVPNKLLHRSVLLPLRYMVHGSVLAGCLALARGWAIHLGGGFTAASSGSGRGFSIYADVTLLIKHVLTLKGVNKVMVVDLDARQGVGYAADLCRDNRIFIVDIFNAHLPPPNIHLRQCIHCKVELKSRVRDFEYLEKLETNFLTSLNKFTPDLLVYVAGTNILAGDSGRLRISPEGIIKRDQLLFVVCRQRRVPIVMLAGGGDIRKSSTVVADSIKNLIRLRLISND